MGILLLAECWPYRSCSPGCFDNSQGRLLASACRLTVEQLHNVCTCDYAIQKFILSHHKTKRYERELLDRLVASVNYYNPTITVLLGKRLAYIQGFKEIEFFELHVGRIGLFKVIPNPMAEFWWKEKANISKVRQCMVALFEKYGK